MTPLMDDLARLSGLSLDLVRTALLVFARVGAAIALVPGLGEATIPARVRLALALAYATVVTPCVMPQAGQDGPVTLPLLAETAAGLVLGFGFRMLVAALQMAASIAAQSTSLAQMTAGVGPEPQPAIGQLWTAAGLALAMMAGLHVRLAVAMIASYGFWPMGGVPDLAQVAQLGLGQISRGFSLALSLAMPFVIGGFLYNLSIAIINRAMPQLMVSMIGAPALAWLGLLLLLLVTPVLLPLWQSALVGSLANPFTVAP